MYTFIVHYAALDDPDYIVPDEVHADTFDEAVAIAYRRLGRNWTNLEIVSVTRD